MRIGIYQATIRGSDPTLPVVRKATSFDPLPLGLVCTWGEVVSRGGCHPASIVEVPEGSRVHSDPGRRFEGLYLPGSEQPIAAARLLEIARRRVNPFIRIVPKGE